MTIGEAIQRVESTLVSGLPAVFRGNYISHRWIYSVLKSMRSRILVQKANKRQKISSWNRQTITCVPLIEVPVEQCSCYGTGNCTIKRTEQRIPEILTGLSDYLIDNVMSGGNRIDIVGKNSVKYQSYSRFTNNSTVAFLDDGYVYVKNAGFVDYIDVTAVFDDPVEAQAFNASNSCDSEDNTGCCENIRQMEFPIDNDLTDTCIMMTIQEMSMAFLRQNNKNNDNENEKEESQRD